MNYLKYIILTLFITLFSYNVSAVNCAAYSAWSSGGQVVGYKTYTSGGVTRLYYNSCGCNGWDGAADNPSVNGEWTLIGVCSSDPAVTTNNESAVTTTTMTLNGNVTDAGAGSWVGRGFIYGTVYNDVDNSEIGSLVGSSSSTSTAGTTGAYSKGISSLCPGTKYYFKAYATNSGGTGYGSILDGTTSSPGTFTTVQNGAFSSAATWGGCGPPSLSIGNTISIGHNVTSSGLVLSEGTDIVVTSGGHLNNTGPITLGGTGAVTTVTTNVGGTVTTTSVGYTNSSTVNNNGTFNITGTLVIDGVANFNTSGTATIGNIDNNNGDFNQTAGTVTVSGWYDCANDCDFDQSGGAMTVTGNFKVWGSGESHMDGTLDVGTVIMDNNGYMDGTGVLTYGSSNVNASNSGAYIACTGPVKYDDNALTAWGSLPASSWDLNTCTSLPIELLSFDVKLIKGVVQIEWITGSEINNDYFEIQVSRNGVDWETIETVKGAGNSFDVIRYSSYDAMISGYDIKYYRLTQFDFDGQNETSQIRLVNFNNDTFFEAFSNGRDIIIKTSFKEKVTVNVNDINGKVVRTNVMSGDNVTYVPTHDLSGGLYFISVIADGVLLCKRVLVR